MDILGSADKAHAAETVAPVFQRGMGCCHHPGMVREPQVIVCAKIKYLPAVYLDFYTLRTFYNAFRFEKAGFADSFKFCGEAADKRCVHTVIFSDRKGKL